MASCGFRGLDNVDSSVSGEPEPRLACPHPITPEERPLSSGNNSALARAEAPSHDM